MNPKGFVARHSRLPVVATSQPRLLMRTVLRRRPLPTEMKSTVSQTYPRYWSDVGNMGRGETFAGSSDEIGDSTGKSRYSFLPYCAGGWVGECALRPWAATVDTDQEIAARQQRT